MDSLGHEFSFPAELCITGLGEGLMALSRRIGVVAV
jgi:hypothetical protein